MNLCAFDGWQMGRLWNPSTYSKYLPWSVHLMERRPRIEISSLLAIKGRLENHLLLGQRGKRKRVVVSQGVNVCPGLTHTLTGAISSVGNGAVFTYCNETHLIEANLYGLCKQDFASFCIRFASQQHIRSPYGTLDIIWMHILPPSCTFSLIVSSVLFGLIFFPMRISYFLLSYQHVLDNWIVLKVPLIFCDSRLVSSSLIVVCHNLVWRGKGKPQLKKIWVWN